MTDHNNYIDELNDAFLAGRLAEVKGRLAFFRKAATAILSLLVAMIVTFAILVKIQISVIENSVAELKEAGKDPALYLGGSEGYLWGDI